MPRPDSIVYTPWTGLRDARRDAGWHLGDLAERVGYSYSHIKDVEGGREGCSEQLLLKLAAALQCRASELARTKPTVRARMKDPERRRQLRRAAAAAKVVPERVAS